MLSRFDKPQEINYNYNPIVPKEFMPNVELWAKTLEHQNKLDEENEKLSKMNPDYIKNMKVPTGIDAEGNIAYQIVGDENAFNAYQQKKKEWHDRLTQAKLSGDVSAYTRERNKITDELKDEMLPGGLYYTLESRAKGFAKNLEEMKKDKANDAQGYGLAGNRLYDYNNMLLGIGQGTKENYKTLPHNFNYNINQHLDLRKKLEEIKQRMGLDKASDLRLDNNTHQLISGNVETTAMERINKEWNSFLNQPDVRKQLEIEDYARSINNNAGLKTAYNMYKGDFENNKNKLIEAQSTFNNLTQEAYKTNNFNKVIAFIKKNGYPTEAYNPQDPRSYLVARHFIDQFQEGLNQKTKEYSKDVPDFKTFISDTNSSNLRDFFHNMFETRYSQSSKNDELFLINQRKRAAESLMHTYDIDNNNATFENAALDKSNITPTKIFGNIKERENSLKGLESNSLEKGMSLMSTLVQNGKLSFDEMKELAQSGDMKAIQNKVQSAINSYGGQLPPDIKVASDDFNGSYNAYKKSKDFVTRENDNMEYVAKKAIDSDPEIKKQVDELFQNPQINSLYNGNKGKLALDISKDPDKFLYETGKIANIPSGKLVGLRNEVYNNIDKVLKSESDEIYGGKNIILNEGNQSKLMINLEHQLRGMTTSDLLQLTGNSADAIALNKLINSDTAANFKIEGSTLHQNSNGDYTIRAKTKSGHSFELHINPTEGLGAHLIPAILTPALDDNGHLKTDKSSEAIHKSIGLSYFNNVASVPLPSDNVANEKVKAQHVATIAQFSKGDQEYFIEGINNNGNIYYQLIDSNNQPVKDNKTGKPIFASKVSDLASKLGISMYMESNNLDWKEQVKKSKIPGKVDTSPAINLINQNSSEN